MNQTVNATVGEIWEFAEEQGLEFAVVTFSTQQATIRVRSKPKSLSLPAQLHVVEESRSPISWFGSDLEEVIYSIEMTFKHTSKMKRMSIASLKDWVLKKSNISQFSSLSKLSVCTGEIIIGQVIVGVRLNPKFYAEKES